MRLAHVIAILIFLNLIYSGAGADACANKGIFSPADCETVVNPGFTAESSTDAAESDAIVLVSAQNIVASAQTNTSGSLLPANPEPNPDSGHSIFWLIGAALIGFIGIARRRSF